MADAHAPYVLWEELLPSGHAATLIICPGSATAGIVLHLNNGLRHVETVANRVLAEQKGWEMREHLLAGKPAG